jgi:hypothetical protein
MNAFWLLKFFAVIAVIWGVNPALGYEMTHDYYNRFRSPYRNNVYLSQQVHAVRGEMGLSKDSVNRYDGYGLQLSAGIEHFRFVQTGAFFSTTQMSDPDAASNEARMVDTGFEAKMVMSTPVSNIIVGGAGIASRAHLNINGERIAVSGTGVRGSFEVSYYASAQVSLVFGASHSIMNYTGKGANGESLKPVSQVSRAGVGLTVWL